MLSTNDMPDPKSTKITEAEVFMRQKHYGLSIILSIITDATLTEVKVGHYCLAQLCEILKML